MWPPAFPFTRHLLGVHPSTGLENMNTQQKTSPFSHFMSFPLVPQQTCSRTSDSQTLAQRSQSSEPTSAQFFHSCRSFPLCCSLSVALLYSPVNSSVHMLSHKQNNIKYHSKKCEQGIKLLA